MALRARRRLFCLIMALLFAFSSTAHVYAATDALMKMPNSVMEESMPDHGMDCGGQGRSERAACIAICATALAVLSEPLGVTFAVCPVLLETVAELPPTDRGLSPEPHPPKH